MRSSSMAGYMFCCCFIIIYSFSIDFTLWNIKVTKKAINDKLQGSVATYLRCGEVFNKQIKKGLLLSLWLNFLSGEYLAKLPARTWLSRELCTPGQHTAKRRRKCTRQSRSCLLLCQIRADFNFFFTRRLSKKTSLNLVINNTTTP